MKNKKVLTIIALCLLLLCACLAVVAGYTKSETQSPAESSGEAVQTEYTVVVKTEGGKPLEGIGVYIYTDATMQELENFVKTDAQGKAGFTAKVSDSYTVVLDKVPVGYQAEASYSFAGTQLEILLPVATGEGDLANITYELGDVMLDFTVIDVDGKAHVLSELLQQKKAVVLNFWYTACNPCKAEFPYMQETYEKYSENMEILAMDPVDLEEADVIAFRDELELTMPVAKADPNWEKAMQLSAYPTTVVIDRYGTIAMIHKGSIQDAETFERIFVFFTDEEYVQTTVKDIEELPELEKPGSNADNPIELGSVRSFEVTVEPGQLMYYNLYRVDKMQLSIKNKDAYAVYNQKTYEGTSGSIGFTLSTPDTYTPAKVVFGNNGKETVTYTVHLDPLRGSLNNPYSLELGEFSTYVYAGNDQGVYYNYKAEEDGLFTVQCLGVTSGVNYDYTLYNLNSYAVRTLREDRTEDKDGNDIVSVQAKKGETILVIIATLPDSSNSYPAANFNTKAYFREGMTEEDQEEEEKLVYAVTVTDVDRKPIPGVVLSMVIEGQTVSMTTDKNGIAYTEQVAGNYDITLRVPEGFTANVTKYQLTAEVPVVSVKLDKLVTETATYKVRVVDENGKPVSGALVTVGKNFGTTDANGNVSFALLKGDYTAMVSVSGVSASFPFPKDSTELTASVTIGNTGDSGGDDTTDVPEASEPEDTKLTYTVKVTDYDGKAVSGVLAMFGDAMVQTNANGIATAKLEPGTYPVELAFTGTTRYYEESKAILTESVTSITIQIADGVNGEYEMLYKDGAEYKSYYVDAGGTYVTMHPDVVNYYLFEPGIGEDGLYRFTTSDPNAVISFWGGSTFFIYDCTAETDYANNAFTRNIKASNIGATFVIGVTGAPDCILEITRIGNAVLSDDDLVPVEWTGKSTPTKAFTLSGVTGKSMKFVDLTGNSQAVYNAADGRYHLNSASGPVLYVALGNASGRYRWLSLSDAFAVTNDDAVLNFIHIVEDSNGNKTKERYNSCMVEYIKCRDSQYGVYPLTDDLIYMLRQGGNYRGWYDSANANYIVSEADRNRSYNADILWMFDCCYFE